MRPVSLTTMIDAPRERVFDLICDLSARPSFCDHFLSEYRLARIDPVGVGAAARFRLGEAGEWMGIEIEATERPYLIREAGHGGRLNRVPAFWVWELAEGPAPTTTELRVTFWTEPSNPFDRLAELRGTRRRWRRGLKRALARLKEIAEGSEPPARIAVGGRDRIPAMPV